MNRTTRFLLAAGIVFAMAFTFSCSDDSSGGNLSCEQVINKATPCLEVDDFQKCFMQSGICGSMSFDVCMEYWDDECPEF